MTDMRRHLFESIPTVDLDAPIFAWRLFVVRGGLLWPTSSMGSYSWSRTSYPCGVTWEAHCGQYREEDHAAPNLYCTCGFYGLNLAIPKFDIPTGPFAMIAALVALWGNYIEHEKGWRSQHMRPLVIAPYWEIDGTDLTGVCERYAVTMVPFEELQQIVSERSRQRPLFVG